MSTILMGQPTPDADKQRFETLDKKSKLTREELSEMLKISDRAQNYNIDLTIEFLNKARKHYEKQEEYYFLTEYAEKISLAYLIKGDPQTGMNFVNQIEKKYNDRLSDEEWIKVQILNVRFLEHIDRNEECLELINKLLPQTKSTLHKAALYTFRGGINTEKSNYDIAATDYYNALRLYKEIDYKPNIITTYNRLGLLNHAIDDFPKALKYYNYALEFALKANSERDLAPIYLNMGNTYQKMDSLDQALLCYDKNLELIKETNNIPDLARNYLNRGNVFLKQKHYSKAFESYKKSLQICNEYGIGIGKMHNYSSMGNAYIEIQDYSKALSVFDSALYHAKELQAKDMEVNIYSKYSEIYKKLGNHQKALEYYTIYHELEQNIMNDEKQKTLSELEIKYETELKDQKITQINQTLATKKAENRIIMLGAASLLFITGLVIFFLMYRNKTLKQLYERNIELMKSFQFKAPEETELEEAPEIINESDDNLKKIFDRILFSLEKEKIYINPTLSLSETAESVKSNDKYVSAAIAEYANMNYSNFINFYRINEAKRLIYEDGHFNLNEVMYACGFNSRTTFYNAFKKHTGLSPKQFKEMGNANLAIA